MKVTGVKFNGKDRPEFFKELRNRVNNHFKENKISKHANANMVFKTTFMVCLYFIPLILMVTNVVTGLWPVMGMWFLMGLGISGIGLSVMHDANHKAYSKNQKVNNALGFLINFLGGYHWNWKIQHNVLHHSYTNVDGHDEDIANATMRFSPFQERKTLHRFQAFYAPFLYGLMTIYWVVGKDFQALARYHQKGLLEKQGLTLRKATAELLFHKAWYIGLTIVLPLIVVDLPWWQTMLGYLMMHFITGLILAFIFQPAHVIEDTDFYVPDENNSIENSWAIHQMKTTSNYANNARLFSWFIGGLNYQIEHHLFPNICHVHYRDLSKIVKQTAKEFDVPYYEHKTFYGAVKSHFSLLNKLGTGRFDREEAKAKAAKTVLAA